MKWGDRPRIHRSAPLHRALRRDDSPSRLVRRDTFLDGETRRGVSSRASMPEHRIMPSAKHPRPMGFFVRWNAPSMDGRFGGAHFAGSRLAGKEHGGKRSTVIRYAERRLSDRRHAGGRYAGCRLTGRSRSGKRSIGGRCAGGRCAGERTVRRRVAALFPGRVRGAA